MKKVPAEGKCPLKQRIILPNLEDSLNAIYPKSLRKKTSFLLCPQITTVFESVGAEKLKCKCIKFWLYCGKEMHVF